MMAIKTLIPLFGLACASAASPAYAAGDLGADTIFDCRMGAIQNPEAEPGQWKSEGSIPFTLFFKIEAGSSFAGANQKVSTTDPTNLLPMSSGFQARIDWPTRLAVAGYDTFAQATMARALRGRSNAKVPTFVTLSLDAAGGKAVAAILRTDAVGNTDMTGAVLGACKVVQGPEAGKLFLEKTQ